MTCWQIINRITLVCIFSVLSIFLKAQSLERAEKLPVWYHDKWYMMDTSGKVYDTTFTFDNILMPSYSPWIIAKKGNHYGLLNFYGDTISPFEFDTILFGWDVYALKKSNEWKLLSIDSLVKENVIACDSIKFIDGIGLFYYRDKKCGLIKQDLINRKVIVSNEFDRIVPYKVGYLTWNNNNFGLISFTFETILETKYKEIQVDYYGNISFWDGYWKYIVNQKELIDPGPTSRVTFYSGTIWKIREHDGKSKLYTIESKNTVLQGFDNYYYLGKDWIVVRKNGKSGLGNLQNKIFFYPKYDFVGNINDTLFYYKQDSLLGLIDQFGNQLTDPIFTDIENGTDLLCNYLKVNFNGKYGVISKKGQIIVKPAYNNIGVYANGFVTYENNKYGLINWNGKKIAENTYQGFNVMYKDNTIQNRKNQKMIFKFISNNKYDFYDNSTKLNSSPCNDFNLSNDILKCYCAEGIELIYLNDNFTFDSRYLYKNIQSVTIQDTTRNKMVSVGLEERVAILEEDQETEKYTMRFSIKKGYGFIPAFEQIYPTKYKGKYTGKLLNDTVHYSLAGLPIYAHQYDLGFSDSDGLLYTKDTLIASAQKYGNGAQSTKLDFAFRKNKKLIFASESPYYHSSIKYIYFTLDAIQKTYLGGKVSIHKNKGNLFLWDYFYQYNIDNNTWFSNTEVIDSILNLENRVCMQEGEWRVIHGSEDNYYENHRKRVFNGRQSFQYFESPGQVSSHIFSLNNEKYGIIGRFNDSVLSPIYDTLYRSNSILGNYLVGELNSKNYLIYDLELKSSLTSFLKASPYNEGYAVVSNSNGNYVIDHNENICFASKSVPITYLGMNLFSLRNKISNQKVYFFLVNKKGIKISELQFDHLSHAINNRIIYTYKNKNGLIDSSGIIVVSHDYDSIRFVNDKILYAYNKSDKMLMDLNGNKIRDIYENEKLTSDCIVGQIKRKKYYIEDLDGNRIELKSESSPKIYKEFYKLKDRSGYRFYSKQGNLLLKTKSNSIKEFQNGITAIRNKDIWILYDENMTTLSSIKSNEFIDFGSLVAYSYRDTTRYINLNGVEVLIEDNALPVRLSLDENFVCSHKQKFAYFNQNGKRISNYFDRAENFKNGYAAVSMNDKWGFIDSTGQQVVKFVFEKVSEVSEGKFVGDQLSKFGLMEQIASEIRVLLPFIFSEIMPVNDKMFFKQENNSGYLLPNKKIVWPSFD